MKLIDKAALVAEIKRRINGINLDTIEDWRYRLQWEHDIEVMKNILSFIDTLEVKEEFKIGETEIYLEDDGGEPPYDGKQWLDLSCTEYEIPSDKFKDGDTVEMIIRKTQKGK